MKSYWYAAAVIAATLTLGACGTSKEEHASEDVRKASDDMQKLSAGAGGDSDVKPVEPVNFRELQTVMPEVAGWQKSNPTGERMTSPFSFSQASVTYMKGDAEVEQKILDSGFNQMLFTPFSTFMAAGYEKETQDGFERSVNVAGNPGWERWDRGTRNGELNVVVNKRFLVQVEGHDIDDIKTLHAVLDQTDLKKLASLR